MVFGKRYNYGDPKFLRLLDLFSDNFRIMSSRWGEVRGWAPISHFTCSLVLKSRDTALPTVTIDLMTKFYNLQNPDLISPLKKHGLVQGLLRLFQQGMGVHTFDSSTGKAKAGGSLI